MQSVVQFVDIEPLKSLWIRHDAFSYNPRRRWPFVQRLCFKLLAWLECYDVATETTYSRIVVSPKDVMVEIFRQQRALADNLGQGGEILLVGYDDWMEIMKAEPRRFAPMSFNGEYMLNVATWDGRTSLEKKPLRVCVIPWMKGILLVPREALHLDDGDRAERAWFLKHGPALWNAATS